MLKKIDAFLQGKKTYLVAILTAVGVGLEMAGISIPWQIVGPVLAALGLGAIRSAVDKVKK